MGKFLAIFGLLAVCCLTQGSEIRREVIFAEGKYIVGWYTNHQTREIFFDVIVETHGFIGFGLSPNGGMAGSDIVIGGVLPDGEAYFTDRHAVDKVEPIIDEQTDWFLDYAFENVTHTELHFHRVLDTCDKDGDIAIQEDTIKIIWSFGSTDTVSYHGTNRGSLAVYMLDPPIPPLDLTPYKKITIKKELKMPKQDTTYWCSMHKGPEFTEKKHAIIFEHITETPEARNHTHHFVIYRCFPPEGEDAQEFFNPYLDKEGECYIADSVVPYEHCITFIFDWSVGGSIVIFPPDVGFPWGVNRHEYYMMEVHMDNPLELEGVEYETGANFYYIDELRELDAAMLVVSHKLEPSFIIPENFTDFTTIGHCSPSCTRKLTDSVHFFNVNLHSHISGRKMKLRHFRDGVELPWVSFDDNYDFNYQEMRPLRDHIELKPGDHLTMECIYDSTWKSPPGTVIGGFSTREEMCESYLYYYPANVNLGFCLSYYPNENLFEKFGIEEVEVIDGQHDPIIIKPDKWANLTMLYVLDNIIEWTDELRAELKNDLQYGDHYDSCGDYGFRVNPGKYSKSNFKELPTINYPQLDDGPYTPPDFCEERKN